ncbi:MAG TPA: ethanolamine ammonia-lyase subunit EutC [Rhodocyclaceae bacterium]|nr:ethanolamine ammonia-lyase subunit EutC [Rhodocyclaceae bacterium]
MVQADGWQALRSLTPARIALGRAGASLPTAEVLRFGLAHARARDAVWRRLDVAALLAELSELPELAADGPVRQVHSAASDRGSYLLRPDLGRRLAPAADAALRAAAAARAGPPPGLCFVLADGLSAGALQQHALPLLRTFRALAGERWAPAPVVIAEQARVALGDLIGEILGARAVAVLIGERPGLSSPDSLGIYLTLAPRVGRSDAERNCISNVRPAGLPCADAARRLLWLLDAAVELGATGVALKDRSAEALLGAAAARALP